MFDKIKATWVIFKTKLLSVHRSFTNWFNSVGLVYLQTVVAHPGLEKYLNEKDLLWIIIVGNILIRVFKTNKAIEHKKK